MLLSLWMTNLVRTKISNLGAVEETLVTVLFPLWMVRNLETKLSDLGVS